MTARSLSQDGSKPPRLAIVVPCYNEEQVLSETARRLRTLCDELVASQVVSEDSEVVLVDDGSRDRTWSIIEELVRGSRCFRGIKLSRNVGHQNALLSGLLNAEGDAVISMDADLQDDLNAIRDMLLAYRDGAEIVYGVRASRQQDTAFKRLTAEGYYRFLQLLGVNIVPDHADYRLMSRRAIEALREFGEVNLFLRGVVPQLGFATRLVTYDRHARFAGESKYPLKKMLVLAVDGVTSFSVSPLRWITVTGLIVSMLSFVIGVWALTVRLFGSYAPGWASTVVPMYFLGGIELLSLGIVGEYLGKVYLETKRRPRFIIEKCAGGGQPEDLIAPTNHNRRRQMKSI
jgi:glycosyltransferase involved in cell wall biosynthesis